MSNVVTIEMDEADFQLLFHAAKEMNVTPADLAGAIVDNYVRENYAEV
jgi:hypothetical protein